MALADERSAAVARALTKVQETKAQALTFEGQNANLPYLTLLSEHETQVNPDWSYESSYHVRIRIQQESAKELGQWPLYYNKSRDEIREWKAFVQTPDGKKVQATNAEDIPAFDQSPLYSDAMVKLVSLPSVEVGSVLDVTVKTYSRSKDIPGHFYDEVPVPVVPTKLARVTYIFPKSKQIQILPYKRSQKPIVEEGQNEVKYSFLFEQTQELSDEDLMPPIHEVYGGFSISSISDWKGVADWFRGLVEKSIVDDDVIEAKAKDLARNAKTVPEKVKAIIEFIQNSFRYVAVNFGDHAIMPNSTVEIYRSRYGDSKDLSILTKQMLDVIGVPTSIVLQSSEFSPSPQNVLPSPAIFEHVILKADVDGKALYFDPQLKGFEPGQFPAGYDNANLLVIGDDGRFMLERLPVMPSQERQVTNSSAVIVNSDGSAVVEARVKLPLEASEGFRSQWAAMGDDEKKKFFDGLQASFAQRGSMMEHELDGTEKRYGPVEFYLKYKADGLYPVVNDMILLKEKPQNDLPPFDQEKRVYPVFFPTNSKIMTTYVYSIPEGFVIDSIPKDYSLKSEFADVKVSHQIKGRQVIASRSVEIKRSLIPAAEYPAMQSFREQLQKNDDQYIVLKKVEQKQ